MKEGVRSFDWRKYIDLAELLLNLTKENEYNEAEYRCGISRAYYGAYNETKEYLKSIGETIREDGSGTHTDVILKCERYESNSNKLWRGLSEKLKSLKAMRIKADYNEIYFPKHVAGNNALRYELKNAIRIAREIIDQIDTISEKEKQGIFFEN